MIKKLTKSGLAMILSGLKVFDKPKVRQEQYPTDSEVAASMLWNAYMLGDIEGKVIADLGCGTGILGIGALLMGAKEVFFVDNDKSALETAKNNISKVKSESLIEGMDKVIDSDIEKINIKCDVVIQNPPFGTKMRHNDAIFLKKALETAPITYSFHKSESKEFLRGFSGRNGARITHIWDFKFPLKGTLEFHRRQIHRIDVSCFRFEKTSATN